VRIEPFEMERWQSTYEHQVAYNLSESGVHPLSTRELLALPGETPAPSQRQLLDIRLGYAQGNGAEPLHDRVALLYPGSDRDNILITHGGAEANFLTTLELLEAGDHVVFMVPNYMQVGGLSDGWGAEVSPWPLEEETGWDADLERLGSLLRPDTKLIVVTNPNNPTGKSLGEKFVEGVVAAAEKTGAWILSDEVYRGAERDGPVTPTFWGKYDRLVVTSGLSKAYGLPGLRIGWAASPDKKKIERLWSYHDYSTICPSPPMEALATCALDPLRREKILGRTTEILRTNLPIAVEWAKEQGARFSFRPPDAGAILWLRYDDKVGSLDLAERLRKEEDVLIVPGEHFGMDGFMRIGYGGTANELREGLARVRRVMDRL